MFIGSKSTSTVLDIFHLGVKAILRDQGLPERIRFETKGCMLLLKGENCKVRVDKVRIKFTHKEGITEEQVQADFAATKIGARLVMKDGQIELTLPSFEWRQLPQLLPMDTLVEKYIQRSLRSQSWTMTVEKFVSAGFNINQLVEEMVNMDASDLHLRAGNQPFVRVDNDLTPMPNTGMLSLQDMRDIIMELGGESELEQLEREKESSFQYHAAGLGYLRCSGYVKTGAMALAIRLIPEEPLEISKLNLCPQVMRVTTEHRGLFLVCGITGSGKSTTLSSLVDYINQIRKLHIITIEDPVEFVYTDKESIISQRMVGRDATSFAAALRGALRQDPDLILVGEMRDLDTIRAGLSAAETGHMVFSTLHTTTAVDTVNRMISYFPQDERDLIRQEIAYTLSMVICQRLLKKIGGGRIPCNEILIGGIPMVRDAIIEGDLEKLQGIMEADGEMQSFDQYAVELFKKGVVNKEEAISACKDAEAFERIMSGIKSSKGRLLG